VKNRNTPIDLKGLKTFPLQDRKSKVNIQEFGKVCKAGGSFRNFWQSLPDILAGKELKEVVSRMVEARRKDRPIIFGLGAHVIKVGLNPLIISLMGKGLVNAVALNGAGIIHDTEIAMKGETSEDVAAELETGNFGMAEDTAQVINQAINDGVDKGWGIGKSVGMRILSSDFPHRDKSILAAGARLDLPVTVHIAIGTDIIHMHPSFNGSQTGEGSHRDFRIFASVVSNLEGGVYVNIGSAVVLPEVFLKVLTLVRNLNHRVENFTTVNMDFICHYRPLANVVTRPVSRGGKGYNFIGHHEIMLPLLTAALIEELEG
jgi:hypothetical protein